MKEERGKISEKSTMYKLVFLKYAVVIIVEFV